MEEREKEEEREGARRKRREKRFEGKRGRDQETVRGRKSRKRERSDPEEGGPLPMGSRGPQALSPGVCVFVWNIHKNLQG